MAAEQDPGAAPSIVSDPVAYLTPLMSSTPTTTTLVKLTGPAAAYMQSCSASNVASLYLSAAARHMPASDPDDTETDLSPRERLDLVEAVGTAATKCTPRSVISKSGILHALVGWMKPMTVLTPAHVEFLQCSILAAQYRYARRIVDQHDWPCPIRGTSRAFGEQLALRYYYQRGLLHMGCEEWSLAIRCFWTVLSVPIDQASAVSVAAWKKLSLCQCLLDRPVVLPACMNSMVSRYFTSPSSSDTHHHNDVRVYLDLIQACTRAPTTNTNNHTKFLSLCTQHHAILQQDGNLGMSERIGTALLHRRVLHLADIYSVVSMAQLASDLQLPPEQLPTLLSQVTCVHVTYDEDTDDRMVSLERASSCSSMIDGSSPLLMDDLMALTSKIRSMDVNLSLSNEYRQSQSPRRPRRGGAGPRGVEEV